MHVLQLGPYPPPHGGVQTNLVAIRSYLLRRGDQCSVINLTRFRQLDHDNVYFPQSSGEVLSLLMRLRYDVAHLHIGGDVTTRLLLLGMLSGGLRSRRTVLTLHSGGYPGSEAGKRARPWTLRGLAFRRFGRIIAVNEQLREMFVDKFRVPASRVRVILPHMLPDRVPEVRLPDEVEDFLGRHNQVLMSMGWLEPEYDFSLQIQALGPVRQAFPDAGLLILGNGRLEPELRALAAASGYGEHILLPGDLPHDMALAVMARCGVFLRTTWYDGDSISVREALHFGTPVIASDNGMRPAGVRLVKARSLDELVNAAAGILRAGPTSRPVRHGDDSHIEAVWELYRELIETEAL